MSQLRHDIDSGRTGDKVPAPDPAAAPLGTDEEAAGTPVPPRAVAQAHAYETSAPTSVGQGAPEPRRDLFRAIAIAAIMVGIVVLMIALGMLAVGL